MAIPPTSFIKYDFSNPSCYPGSGTSFTDLSGNVNGDILGSPTFVSSGQQSYFDLTSGSQRVQSNTYNFPVRDVYTISAIFKVSYNNDYNTIISLAEADGFGTVPFIAAPFNSSASNFPISSNGFGVNTITSNTLMANDTWALLTLTADGTTQKLYLNGALVGSGAYSLSFNGSLPRFQTGYPGTIAYAAIQKVAIMQMWDFALTSLQVQDLKDFYDTRFSLSPPPPPAPVLIASYSPFDNASYPGTGNTWFDLTANNNDLTLSNQTFHTTPVKSFTFATGYANKIAPTNLPTNIYTIDAWIKFNSTSEQIPYMLGRDAGGGGQSALLAFGFSGYNGGEPWVQNGSSTGIVNLNLNATIGEWYNITWTANGTISSVYVNGVIDNTGPQYVGIAATNVGIILAQLIGGDGSPSGANYYSDASFGQFDIYNGALGSTTVLQNYNTNVVNYNPPVPAALSFEVNAADPSSYSGSGTTVYDLSPAARVGNLDSSTFGSSTWSPNFGGIFTLDGYNDIFEFSGGGLAVSQPGSISAWFRSNAPFNTGNVVSQGLYGNNGWGLNLGGAYSTNPNVLYLVSHGVGYRSSGIAVTVGEWAFATLNYNVDGTSNLFINGGLGATMAAIGMSTPQELIRIGYDGGVISQPQIDVAQVYMHTEALTLAEHTDLFDATKAPFLPPTPVPIGNSNVGGRSFNKGLNG